MGTSLSKHWGFHHGQSITTASCMMSGSEAWSSKLPQLIYVPGEVSQKKWPCAILWWPSLGIRYHALCGAGCCWWWDISLCSILDYFGIFGLTMHPSFMFWHLLVYYNDWEWILTYIWWLFWRNPTVAIAWLVFLMDPRRPFLGETSSWNLPPYQHDRHAEETWTGSGEWTEEIPGYSPKHPDKF